MTIRFRSFYVHRGPAAIRHGRYWLGYASGNVCTGIKRRTAERALADARRIEEGV